MPRVTIALAASLLAVTSAGFAGDGQPWPTFAAESRIRMKIGDIRVSDVVSVEGNLFTTNVLTVRQGGDAGTVTKLPGPTTPGDIIVRRAVRTDETLWDWYQQVRSGSAQVQVQVKDVTVLYLGAHGQPAVRFELLRCFPSAYALHAGTTPLTVVSVEAVTLSCEGATRHAP